MSGATTSSSSASPQKAFGRRVPPTSPSAPRRSAAPSGAAELPVVELAQAETLERPACSRPIAAPVELLTGVVSGSLIMSVVSRGSVVVFHVPAVKIERKGEEPAGSRWPAWNCRLPGRLPSRGTLEQRGRRV